MKKIFISNVLFGKADPDILKKLFSQPGLSIQWNEKQRLLSQDELIEDAKDANIVIASTENLNGLIRESSALELIAKIGVGYDNVDLELCQQKGIRVTYTPDAVTQSVAELTVSLIVFLIRRLHLSAPDLKQGLWERRIGREISELSLGIIGFGRIGNRLIELLSVFRPKKIWVNDIQPIEAKVADVRSRLGLDIESTSFENLLIHSDLVSVHVNLNPSSHHLISDRAFQLMPKGCYLINTSRGKVVDERALYNALETEKIDGAALDVFENEPYQGELTQFRQLILTPHIGACSQKARRDMDLEATESILAYLEGKALKNELTLAKPSSA